MNRNERGMVELLRELREIYAIEGVKAEFEAEGTRTEELMRLKEISLAAGVTLTLKIGGCEALRDMYDARSIGVDHLVAPMVESAFALQKFLRAVDIAFPKDEQAHKSFLVNIETADATDAFAEMLRAREIDRLTGIVLGRGDLTMSMGMARTEVDCDKVYTLAAAILGKAKEAGLTTVIGGGVTAASLDFFRRLPPGSLDRYETRKVCFRCPAGLGQRAADGIRKSLEFELQWLISKQSYHRAISEEDQNRISTLQTRLGK